MEKFVQFGIEGTYSVYCDMWYIVWANLHPTSKDPRKRYMLNKTFLSAEEAEKACKFYAKHAPEKTGAWILRE